MVTYIFKLSHYLGYFEDERAIGTEIEYLKLQNTILKKYIY